MAFQPACRHTVLAAITDSGHEPLLLFALGLIMVVVELIFFPGVAVVAVTGRGDGGFDGGNAFDQRFGFQRAGIFLEVAAEPVAQVAGLADIQQGAGRVVHPVHAG